MKMSEKGDFELKFVGILEGSSHVEEAFKVVWNWKANG